MSEVSKNNSVLELSEFNPYRNGRIVKYSNGQEELQRNQVDYEGNEKDIYYPVKIDDTLTRIAWIHYRNVKENPEKYWFVIADANQIDNPLDIDDFIGSELLVPDIILFEQQSEIQGF